jgi:hypothetical protein
VVLYDVASNTYDVTFNDTLEARRNHAGVFVPLNTPDPFDGLPGMWVFGGFLTADGPPFAGTEFFAMSTLLPDITVTPAILEASLLPDQTITQTLTIANVGGADLVWTLTSDQTWLSALPAGGTLPVGGTVDVTVTFDSTGLVKGTYTATLSIASNDPDEVWCQCQQH